MHFGTEGAERVTSKRSPSFPVSSQFFAMFYMMLSSAQRCSRTETIDVLRPPRKQYPLVVAAAQFRLSPCQYESSLFTSQHRPSLPSRLI